MDEWIDGWMGGWVDRWMLIDGWMDGGWFFLSSQCCWTSSIHPHFYCFYISSLKQTHLIRWREVQRWDAALLPLRSIHLLILPLDRWLHFRGKCVFHSFFTLPGCLADSNYCVSIDCYCQYGTSQFYAGKHTEWDHARVNTGGEEAASRHTNTSKTLCDQDSYQVW